MIWLTGDTHLDFDRVFEFCEKNHTTTEDILIILGDAGINFCLDKRDRVLKEYLSTLEITLFCIHGNHEERPFMIKGYTEKEWRGGKKAIAIGGAYSVDKHYRLSLGRTWFPTEQPTEEIKKDVERALDGVGWRVDAVLSHTVPLKY